MTEPPTGLRFDPASPLPPFEQLKRAMTDGAVSGALPHGARLPTVRALADELGLAANTVARAYREGHPSARFATCTWGGGRSGKDEVVAEVAGDALARLVNLDGTVVASGVGEVRAPVSALSEAFVLDLDGLNRYVMTTAATLAPLLALLEARVEVEVSEAAGLTCRYATSDRYLQVPLPHDLQGFSTRLTLRNTSATAALGIVLEGGDRTLFSDNVLDLLPGEEREILVAGDAADVTGAGWNCAF